ncbi:MAG: hypothetical protein KF765_12390 [Parvibaculaceae bacterium]|nr:hypothetical protein [Parvibaculaceae bacterium]
MTTAQAKPAELAEDGLPKVDVIELATKLVMPHSGPRAATMVSTREIRAMAQSIMALNQLGVDAAGLIYLLNRLGDAPAEARRGLAARAEVQATKVEQQLQAFNYMEIYGDQHP